jgi:hypothetical protein
VYVTSVCHECGRAPNRKGRIARNVSRSRTVIGSDRRCARLCPWPGLLGQLNMSADSRAQGRSALPPRRVGAGPHHGGSRRVDPRKLRNKKNTGGDPPMAVCGAVQQYRARLTRPTIRRSSRARSLPNQAASASATPPQPAPARTRPTPESRRSSTRAAAWPRWRRGARWAGPGQAAEYAYLVGSSRELPSSPDPTRTASFVGVPEEVVERRDRDRSTRSCGRRNRLGPRHKTGLSIIGLLNFTPSQVPFLFKHRVL